MVVQPGQEIFPNYTVTMPNTSTVYINGFRSWMTTGSSHHFILYEGGAGSPQWLYGESTPGAIVGWDFPQDVGYPIPTGTTLTLNMHFINTGTTVLYPKIKVNVYFVKNVANVAAAMVSFNTTINVPAASASGPGTQTVSGVCSPPAGSHVFLASTHTHKHAVAADIQYVTNGQSRTIVHTTDWEHPAMYNWQNPDNPIIVTQSGDTFPYSCSYSNDSNAAVTLGETAASNEMCMEVSYYYPAGQAPCN
jgi:Copper type II ascorbate-dependent monooxygenase, C-terminal domain